MINDESPRRGASEGNNALGAVTSCTGAEAWRLPSPAARAAVVVEMEYGTCAVEEESAAPPCEEAVPGKEFTGGGDLDVGME